MSVTNRLREGLEVPREDTRAVGNTRQLEPTVFEMER